MNSKDFVEAVERHVGRAAMEDTIANMKAPPGRRLSPEVKAHSDWYNVLSTTDAAHVERSIAAAVHATLFGLLAVLDGARTIDDENGRFELNYLTDQRTLLNPSTIDLHDLLSDWS